MSSSSRPILVAVDPRGCAVEVADWAAQLAADLGVPAVLMTAVHLPSGVDADTVLGQGPFAGKHALEALREDAMDALYSLRFAFSQRNVEVELEVAVGDPIETVVERAGNMRLVVVGSHGRRGLKRLLFGSVAEGIVRQSPVPVLTVRSESVGLHLSDAQFAVNALADG